MININEVIETNKMIEKENLDVRTITLGISLLDCMDSDLNKLNDKIYQKITSTAKNLVATGEAIEKEFGIPIVNKKNFCYANCLDRRCGMSFARRFCDNCKDTGQSEKRCGSEFSWRIFCAGFQGDDKGRRAFSAFDSTSACTDRACVQFCQSWFNKNRN